MEQNLTLEQIQNFEGKYPKQLWYLFLVEMWERFCFYGMRGVLTIFMADQVLGLSLSDKEANLKYGAIQVFRIYLLYVGGSVITKWILAQCWNLKNNHKRFGPLVYH